MLNQKGYFDLLDWLENEKIVRPQQFFQRMQTEFGIAQLIYIDAAVSPAGLKLHRLHHTFPPGAVVATTMLGNAALVRVARAALNTIRPLDWASLVHSAPLGAQLLAEAHRLGLSTEGVIYPLISREGRAALLSISLDMTARDLQLFRRIYDRDIHALAAQFHACLLEPEHGTRHPDAPQLTPRELETLGWSAAGKSYWEIAVILGISERTVRFFMANTRRKLNAVSNTQAVARAVWQGLIQHQ
ncbi:MAG: helix-turn-helix transcriptional regulator [Allorhizobium sp.]